jgi:2-polyprenyl-3-methyl-5-hydroxy-6-metoxy-1,4-benzoquinol methylase
MNLFNGDFYDEDYFERGRTTGKSWLMNYRWMPKRSFKEAKAFISYFDIDEESYVLDVGCAKGFLVKAFRELGIKADGCDISDYALSFTPPGCWNCSEEDSWDEAVDEKYTHIVLKDVLEHLNEERLSKMLSHISKISSKMMCVIPMGEDGVYRIAEYHTDISHIVIENEEWWREQFKKAGWSIIKECPHVPGLKDNWQDHADGLGNHVFVLEKKS